MGRKKKEIREEEVLLKPIHIEEEIEDTEEIDDEISRGEILIGKNFKIVVTKRCKEVLEKYKGKRKDDNDNEIEFDAWRSHGYSSTFKYACKIIKDVMINNKIFNKRLVGNVDELIQIIKESDGEINKLFKGLED